MHPLALRKLAEADASASASRAIADLLSRLYMLSTEQTPEAYAVLAREQIAHTSVLIVRLSMLKADEIASLPHVLRAARAKAYLTGMRAR